MKDMSKLEYVIRGVKRLTGGQLASCNPLPLLARLGLVACVPTREGRFHVVGGSSDGFLVS